MFVRTVLLTSAALVLSAQGTPLRQPKASPGASIIQEVGISSVKLDYSRPGVKGRKIWGGLVPQDQVWRAGANAATVLTLSDAATIGGKPVPAGSYALFVIPGKDKWTWIVNKDAKQWGTYAHKPELDVVRIEAPVVTVPHPTEWMAFDLDLVNADTAKLTLRWEKLASGFEIAFDTKALYGAHVDEVLKKAAPTDPAFVQAANYCIENKVDLDKAAAWLETSQKAGFTFRNRAAKARLLQAQGKRADALAELDQAITLAKDPASKASKATVDYLTGMRAEWAAGK